MTPEDILNFWFYEIGRDRWMSEDPALDAQIKERFAGAYEEAITQKHDAWRETPEGLLALLLLIEVFPRHMFRGTSRAFESEELACDLAREGIIRHFDDRIDRQFKLFFYLPFMNSENLGDQRLALYYIRERIKEDEWLTRAEQHFDIVQRFGRFPNRNPALGREPTPEEQAFLQQFATAGRA
jgi:uncharacterized protein (DUF924 family)